MMDRTQGSHPPTTGQPARPVPEPVSPMFADYLDGLAGERLVIRECAGCGARQWPPRALCGHCRKHEFRPAVISGRGVVHTFTVVRRGFDPWFAGRVPYGIVVADLGDGIRILGNYAGPDVDSLACGQPVRARFEHAGDYSFIAWEPAGAAGQAGGPGGGQ